MKFNIIIIPALLISMQVFADNTTANEFDQSSNNTGDMKLNESDRSTNTATDANLNESDRSTNTANDTKANKRDRSAKKADNTAVNERDRSSEKLTADQQGNESKDMDITRRIRSEIMKEKNLSTYAQNIKIITQNGKVTLKGPVRYEREQENLLSKARTVAGASNVTSEMAVVPE